METVNYDERRRTIGDYTTGESVVEEVRKVG